MDDKVKKISEEMLEYYRKHIYECPIDILRVLYAEKDADLCAANQIVGEQIDIIKELERKIDIKDEYCNIIWCLGVDYDGYETPEGLKSLIDELVTLAKRAVKNDDKYAMYEGCGSQNSTKYYNILHEEVEKTKEDKDGKDKM